ncbi:hypothetical protein F4825DRAFT_472501 [Nemania diffusa]|nr:hypothetical protein F4825DRAFT_472501 [Nemania diffusa]
MDYKKLYEEAERRRQEERQLRLEAERKQKEAEYDAAAATTALRAEREENARIELNRSMEAYLIDIDGINNYMQRLIPSPVKRSNTLSEGQKSQSSTSGRTSILGKYYPLKICPWDDFRSLYQDAFERARAVIGNSSRFPSVLAARAAKESMDDQLPPAFLGSESFRHEPKTSYILHEALQRPAQYVMNAYLDAVGSQIQLYFDNRSAVWQVRTSNSTDMMESEASSNMQGDNESSAGDVVQKLPRKTQPDCLVLASAIIFPTPKAVAEEQEEQAARRLRSVYRLVMGEHKPAHRIRATAVSSFNQTPLPENIMIQLAKAKNKTPSGRRRGRAQAGLDADEAHILDLLPGQVYFANALTQTFHYMVTSGVKYGYLASGETLTLLKLSQDDPTTLLIHSEVFPQYCRTTLDEPNSSREDTGNIRDLPVSLLCGLCLLAYESTPEPARQRSINVSQLALFPELPPSLSPESSSSRGSSARGRRRRRRRDDDDDDNNSHDEDNNREDRGGYKSPSNASSSSASRLCPPAHQPRMSSPLKRQRSASHQSPEHQATNSSNVNDKKKRRIMLPSLPSPFDPSTFRPIRPYCTQACLRGLVQDEGIDYSCPNVLLHLEAQRRACRRLKGPRWGERHAITVDELRELVQHQLLENVELDCQCLLEDGARGAVGCLFKITVTGFGYTLVAKGVETLHRRRLQREVDVYNKLDAQQGLLIPVCLGIVRLLLPYPMVDCTLVTHMLLMSYAGEPLHWQPLRQKLERTGINVDEEERRTIRDLRALGLTDEDDISTGNITWCAETNRAMKIDFDQAYVSTTGANSSQVQETMVSLTSGLKAAIDSKPLFSTKSQENTWRSFNCSLSHSTINSLLLA